MPQFVVKTIIKNIYINSISILQFCYKSFRCGFSLHYKLLSIHEYTLLRYKKLNVNYFFAHLKSIWSGVFYKYNFAFHIVNDWVLKDQLGSHIVQNKYICNCPIYSYLKKSLHILKPIWSNVFYLVNIF